MADIAGVSSKVQRYLQDLQLKFMVEGPGDFSLRFESIRIFVRVWSPEPGSTEAPTFVRFTVPVLLGVNDTPELYRHIAFHSDDYVFGHLSLFQSKEDELRIFYTHELLGDYIDTEEFNRVLLGMASVANDLDDQLQVQFGGSRFHEDS